MYILLVMDKTYFKFCNCVIKVTTPTPAELVFTENVLKFKYAKSKPNIKITHVFKLRTNPFKKLTIVFKNKYWLIQKDKNNLYHYYYKPYKIKGIVNEAHTDWIIQLPRHMKQHYDKNLMNNLCLFYSDQLMFYPYLVKNEGLLLHGNGLTKNNKGIILLGDSGRGKSTLTRMLEVEGWTLLCDDRTLVLKNKMYGHWCHGSYNRANNVTSVVDRVYYLNHHVDPFILKKTNAQLAFYKHSVDYLMLTREYTNRIFNTLNVKHRELYFNLSKNIIKKIEEDLL